MAFKWSVNNYLSTVQEFRQESTNYVSTSLKMKPHHAIPPIKNLTCHKNFNGKNFLEIFKI